MATTYSDCLAVAKAELRAAKHLLDREIQDYPPPYSACDEQYNHLLCERRRISRLLNEFEAAYRVPTPRAP
ncbi:MAG: hypothetical protein JJ902_23145 [Roseibium sp.]|nr:hypothetical protein [Roseibium sp.]